MKAIDIALKDMRQSFRSRAAIVFMFLVPILITVLFYFMFGAIAGDDEGFSLPQTTVVVVNMDAGEAPGVGSLGGVLVASLQDAQLAALLSVVEMADAAAARTAVDNQEAALAVIIPPGFTEALTGQGEQVQIQLYRDPTLIIGPAVVSAIVGQVVDGMASATIGIEVARSQLLAAGADLTPEMIQAMVDVYAEKAVQGRSLTRLQAPPGQDANETLAGMLAFILGGMMVFYAFFTGANVLNSILSEQEHGTLQRLLTTPTSHLTIFGGKFLAALLVLTVQVSVLLLFGRLVFGIRWGEPLPVAIAAIGLILVSASTGLFLVSLLKDPRQGGIIYGGLLTLTGMIGLFTVFTAGSPNTPAVLDTISLLVPQGWAMRPFRQAIDHEPLSNIALTFAVVLLWSIVFFAIGQYRLGKRFAR